MGLFVTDGGAERLPVSLITGFLGSGKTTLLNKLLQHPDMAHTAVAINEFGEVGLDQVFIEHDDGDVVVMANGCLCCTIRGDLEETVMGVFTKRERGEVPDFDRFLIETTGLADPAPILQVLLSNPMMSRAFSVDAVVTTVDGLFGLRQLDEHEESVKQAAIADRLLITKTDLAEADAIASLTARLRALNPGADIYDARHGEIAPAKLFGAGLFGTADKAADARRWLSDQHHDDHADHGHGANVNRHDEHISTFCLTIDEPVDWRSFSRWLGRLKIKRADNLLRVKGLLHVAGERGPIAIHGVHHVFHPPVALERWPSEDHRSRIVFITRDLAAGDIEASWHDFQMTGSESHWRMP